MPWYTNCLDRILDEPPCGYVAGGAGHPEPTSLCAMAWGAVGSKGRCLSALKSLAQMQEDSGSVTDGSRVPSRWATSLAVLAWSRALPATREHFRRNIDQGIHWLLANKGEQGENDGTMGHDTRLIGWPWVDGTHSWVIPTAFAVLALKTQGLGGHPRCREGVALLVDRMLVGGGCNYGNPSLFGQELNPQVEPTGIALLALAGEVEGNRERIARSLDYLARSTTRQSSQLALSYGVMGLTAHDRTPALADRWLEAASQRSTRPPTGPVGWALLVLAALKYNNPLIMKACE